MAQFEVPITEIPHFLTADDSIELQRLTLENNIKHGVVFKYHIFVFKDKLYAHYDFDIVKSQKKQNELRGAK